MNFRFRSRQEAPRKLKDYPTSAIILSMLVAFACAMGALYFWVGIRNGLPWNAEWRELRAGRDLSVGFVPMLILFSAVWAAARPAGWRELGFVALISLLQNIWFLCVLEPADLTQVWIAPNEAFTVTLVAYLTYVAPAALTGWVVLRRRGIIPDPDGDVSGPAMALLALPGLLVCCIALDRLDLAGQLPLLNFYDQAKNGFGRTLYLCPILVPVYVCSLRARPNTTYHWIVLAAAVTLAMLVWGAIWGGAVLLYSAVDPHGVWKVASIGGTSASFAILAEIVPRLGRRLAGPNGPWPEDMR